MYYQKLIEQLIQVNAVQATKFISPKEIIRATRKRYKGKFHPRQIEITLTIGKPNFRERKSIKNFQKAGVKFPVQKIQLKLLPVKKK